MNTSAPPDHQTSECARHSGAAASWWCERCGHNLCDKCVQVHQTVPAAFATCKACGAACRAGGVRPAEEEPDERPFLQRLAGVFAYPFGGSGWVLLLAGGLIFWVLGVFSILPMLGMFLQLMVGLYITAYMMKLISSSANGESQLPGWPDVTDMWDDLLRPVLLVWTVVAAGFAPAFVWAVVLKGEAVVTWVFVIGGVIYLPMALIAIALWDSVRALNPFVVFPAILRIPLDYLVACVGLGVVFALEAFLVEQGERLPVVGSLFAQLGALYFLAVEMRILGLLYYTNRQRIGWFE